MRICCITGCSSRYADKDGRSFFKYVFKIKTIYFWVFKLLFVLSRRVGREKVWLDVIKKYQPISENGQIYICDLHFDLNDICKGKIKSTVRKGAVPNLEYVFYYFDSMDKLLSY